MNWSDHELYIEIFPPKEFDFSQCLVFLARSDQEILHQIEGGCLFKLIKVDGELVLFKLKSTPPSIRAEFLIGPQSTNAREKVAAYIWEWFDFDQDLRSFYHLAANDNVLRQVCDDYYGLRMMGIPDLFEALTWAIIGQQINLTFAYTLKRRFVEHFGECMTIEGKTFCVFPEVEKIASLHVDALRKLQFSSRKAEYIIGIAQAINDGELSKDMLLQKQDYQQVHASLVSIRGVGAWTADYVMMKCLHYSSAFPVADVGLHNALKKQLGLDEKPTIEEIRVLGTEWEGWQAYATFYLWRSLYE